jgi:hypothetical protein
MANVDVALKIARTYLGDDRGVKFTDATLMPKLQQAHRELQLKLWLNGLPVTKEVSAIFTVPAGAVDLGVNQPTDLIEPQLMKEKAVGEPISRFIDMTEVNELPDVDQSDSLRYWCWREEIITLLGATTTREVRLDYIKGLTIPVLKTDPIGFILGEAFLGPRTAALAGADSNEDAQNRLSEIIAANVRGSQSLPTRRRPYRRFRTRII